MSAVTIRCEAPMTRAERSDSQRRGLAADVTAAILRDDRRTSAQLVSDLGDRMRTPHRWNAALANALKTDDWSEVGRQFGEAAFVGKTGSYLVAGPYTLTRGGRRHTRLSLSVGRVLPYRLLVPRIEQASAELFGAPHQRVPRVIPVRPIATAGHIGGEAGEAFVVPDAWMFPGSSRGPAINDMPNQAARLRCGWPALDRIFGRATTSTIRRLLEGRIGWAIRADEYALHDGGHASGVGIETLIAKGLLEHPWNRGVEEARADWVSFALAPKVVGYRRAGMIFLSNLATRFGVDAHRRGGFQRDPDVITATLTLDRLIQAHLIESRRGHLHLRVTDFEELGRAAELVGTAGVDLTRAVLQEHDLNAVDRIYGSLGSHINATRVVLDALVREPARGAFTNLR